MEHKFDTGISCCLMEITIFEGFLRIVLGWSTNQINLLINKLEKFAVRLSYDYKSKIIFLTNSNKELVETLLQDNGFEINYSIKECKICTQRLNELTYEVKGFIIYKKK